jgi:hypothetical protein
LAIFPWQSDCADEHVRMPPLCCLNEFLPRPTISDGSDVPQLTIDRLIDLIFERQ